MSAFISLVVLNVTRFLQADLKPYDYMALVPVVEGAGGVITDWRVRCGRCKRDNHSAR